MNGKKSWLKFTIPDASRVVSPKYLSCFSIFVMQYPIRSLPLPHVMLLWHSLFTATGPLRKEALVIGSYWVFLTRSAYCGNETLHCLFASASTVSTRPDHAVAWAHWCRAVVNFSPREKVHLGDVGTHAGNKHVYHLAHDGRLTNWNSRLLMNMYEV